MMDAFAAYLLRESSDLEAFFRAVAANPYDLLPLQVAADWLAENDYPEGDLILRLVRAAQGEGGDPEALKAELAAAVKATGVEVDDRISRTGGTIVAIDPATDDGYAWKPTTGMVKRRPAGSDWLGFSDDRPAVIPPDVARMFMLWYAGHRFEKAAEGGGSYVRQEAEALFARFMALLDHFARLPGGPRFFAISLGGVTRFLDRLPADTRLGQTRWVDAADALRSQPTIANDPEVARQWAAIVKRFQQLAREG